MPAQAKVQIITTAPGSDVRQLEIQYNVGVTDRQMVSFACSADHIWSWQTATANSAQALGRGSTDTAVASGAFTFATGGFPEKKAAITTGTALNADTITADLWTCFAFDIAAGGTIAVLSPAITTGYATEALAIAAVPSRVAAKARMGYITVKTMTGTAWIGATDALAGGTTGNEASITNYYPFDGYFAATGTATTATVYGPTGAQNANGLMWSGGRNGVLIPTVLSRGSTDTNLQTTAFTFNANGVCNIAKAAVTAGTALGALGTIPADQWGIIVAYINSLGTLSYLSGGNNYSSGYGSEAQAILALGSTYPTAGLCQLGYITVKTGSGLAWIAGTDALAGGTTGNEASATNYYPSPAPSATAGQAAAQIASSNGMVLTSAQF